MECSNDMDNADVNAKVTPREAVYITFANNMDNNDGNGKMSPG